MKNLLLLIICLFPTLLYGVGEVGSVGGKADSAIASVMGVAGGSIGTLCGKTYNDGDAGAMLVLGTDSEYTTTSIVYNNQIRCYKYTAAASKNLGYAYALKSGSTEEKGYIGVFADDGDGVPDSGDAIVSGSSIVELTSSSAGWVKSASKVGGSVANGSINFLCFMGGNFGDTPNDFTTLTSTSGDLTRYYIDSGWDRTNTTLDGTWSTTGSREHSIYVEGE